MYQFSRLSACALAAAISVAVLGAADAAGPRFVVRATEAPSSRAAADAMTRRYIVRYRNGTAQRASTLQALGAARTALSRSGIAAAKPGLSVRHLRRLAGGADVIELSRPLDRVSSAALLRTLASDPAVAYAEPDRLLQHTGMAAPSLMPNDPYLAQYQWHLHSPIGGINAPAAWDKSNGAGVVVAVIDTGITDHNDLDGNMLPGYDFISDAFVSRRPTDERVAGAHDYGDWNNDDTQCPLRSSSFHGTHVAGTVAEMTNNGRGMAGVAHGAKVLPVRVLGRCGGYLSDIADAVVWASGGSVPGVPANTNPAEVINMSLGGPGACDVTLQSAIDTAVANGTTVVVAAGNDNDDASGYAPASCNNTITVGATRVTGGRASYSNYGSHVDLSAPGGGGGVDGYDGYVWQALNDSLTAPELGAQVYGGMSGTSMASPHVAGTVALVQSIAPAPLTPAQVEALLKGTARAFPVAIPSATPMGSGILNAKAALNEVVPCQGPDCESSARPIANKMPVGGLSGAIGTELLYSLDVPVGASGLSFMTYGGSGDVSLLVSYGTVPTALAADVRSVRPGNSESARIAVARAGTYYIKVVGVKAFAGVTLEARHN
ncbi:S8 family peptidase [Lysobacter niastensis]|uniref:S8 family serine peptidase n=1 Tax=Lysobacter niastensis TaxID=380629 RepID=A0ABS0B239_9GAMM|nr:S8 family peptidase [Lysobacter niastensis]MBF6022535.1 S8 family serine peptidase [Lysobacter niastensis]